MIALIQDGRAKGNGGEGESLSILFLTKAAGFAGLFYAQGSLSVGAELRETR